MEKRHDPITQHSEIGPSIAYRAATENNVVRIDEGQRVGDGDGQRVGGAGQGWFVSMVQCRTHDWSRRVLTETAAPAAVAAGTSGIDDQVTNHGRRVLGATPDRAIEDPGVPDAGADGDREDRSGSRAAKTGFRHGAAEGIGIDPHRNTEPRGERIGQGHVRPAEVVGEEHDAFLALDRSRHGDTGRRDELIPDGIVQPLPDLLDSEWLGGSAAMNDGRDRTQPLAVEGGDAEMGAAQIGGEDGWLATHSRTPVAVTPSTNWRCSTAKSSTSGKAPITATAMISL